VKEMKMKWSPSRWIMGCCEGEEMETCGCRICQNNMAFSAGGVELDKDEAMRVFGFWMVNLTPHSIKIYEGKDVILEVPPSGEVARVKKRTLRTYDIEGIPVTVYEDGAVEGMPEEEENVYLIVSSMVLDALPYRRDLLAPDTNKGVRDEKGRLLGVRGFTSTLEQPDGGPCPRCGAQLLYIGRVVYGEDWYHTWACPECEFWSNDPYPEVET